MSRRVRRVLITTFGILAVAVGMAALAWACTPSAYISVGPGSGLAGSSVTVTGNGFVPGPVDIRWNGTSLGTATGPSFSTKVTIPSASPGVYYIRATATSSEGVVAGQASRAFRVTVAPAATAAPSPASPAPASSTTTSGRVKPAAGQPDRGESRSGEARRQTASKAGQGSPVVTTRSGTPVFGDSVSSQSTRAQAARAGTDDSAAATADRSSPRGRAPSARSASSDLWSGFKADAQGASLPSTSGPATSPGSALIPGVALLILGGLALMGGAAMAVASRRRRVARR